MTQQPNDDLKPYKMFKRFTLIQMMLMIAVSGLILTFIAYLFQI